MSESYSNIRNYEEMLKRTSTYYLITPMKLFDEYRSTKAHKMKIIAFMNYLRDAQLKQLQTTREYAKKWCVVQSTANNWMNEFKERLAEFKTVDGNYTKIPSDYVASITGRSKLIAFIDYMRHYLSDKNYSQGEMSRRWRVFTTSAKRFIIDFKEALKNNFFSKSRKSQEKVIEKPIENPVDMGEWDDFNYSQENEDLRENDTLLNNYNNFNNNIFFSSNCYLQKEFENYLINILGMKNTAHAIASLLDSTHRHHKRNKHNYDKFLKAHKRQEGVKYSEELREAGHESIFDAYETDTKEPRARFKREEQELI